MPEPLKNIYNQEFIATLCSALKTAYQKFQPQEFTRQIFKSEWETKELKERMRHITETLYQFLPKNYRAALEVLKPVSTQFKGFEAMFFPDFVELYGLKEYEQSVSALEHFTQYSSSEFAVRPFIQKYPKRMMAQMEKWARSKSDHVRRLASEGCRPRLPWAMALPEFKKDPQPVLRILESLKADKSEYVRRSVANNLNDISKDHPQVAIKIAQRWLGENAATDWVVKHGCRTLLKQGVPDVMELFGFFYPQHISIKELKVPKTIRTGDDFIFSFCIQTQEAQLGRLRVEYAFDFMKKNGKQRRKVFKISESNYSGKKKQITKRHSFKTLSTRKYYPGSHGVAIIVNGLELICREFQLVNHKAQHNETSV